VLLVVRVKEARDILAGEWHARSREVQHEACPPPTTIPRLGRLGKSPNPRESLGLLCCHFRSLLCRWVEVSKATSDWLTLWRWKVRLSKRRPLLIGARGDTGRAAAQAHQYHREASLFGFRRSNRTARYNAIRSRGRVTKDWTLCALWRPCAMTSRTICTLN
jgi:hypothetical protein